MIDYYYHVYDDGIDQLCGKINVYALKSSVEENIRVENDIILIHAIHKVAKTTRLYRKDDVKKFIWDKIHWQLTFVKALLNDDTPTPEECKESYGKLFDFCWMQKFKTRFRTRKMCHIAYSYRPLERKLIDSNITLIACIILFAWFHSELMHNNWMWVFTPAIIWYGLSAAAIIGKRKTEEALNIAPIVCAILHCIVTIAIIFSEDSLSHGQIKTWFIISITYLMWYPIILLNKQRIIDLYDE